MEPKLALLLIKKQDVNPLKISHPQQGNQPTMYNLVKVERRGGSSSGLVEDLNFFQVMAHFMAQAGILEGDSNLVGNSCCQVNLLGCKRAWRIHYTEPHRADDRSLDGDRDEEEGPDVTRFYHVPDRGGLGIVKCIDDGQRTLRGDHLLKQRVVRQGKAPAGSSLVATLLKLCGYPALFGFQVKEDDTCLFYVKRSGHLTGGKVEDLVQVVGASDSRRNPVDHCQVLSVISCALKTIAHALSFFQEPAPVVPRDHQTKAQAYSQG